MSESIQHKIGRVRPPRVQITYDVETEGAQEKRELPFIMGILAPLSGDSDKDLPPIRQRKMVQIDQDNFHQVLASCKPQVKTDVPNTLPGAEKPTLGVDLTFKHLDDFNPVRVVERTPALNTIYQQRSRLRDFLGKMDGNDPLGTIMLELVTSEEKRDALKKLISEAAEGLNEARALEKEEDRSKAIVEVFKALFEEEEGKFTLKEGSDVHDMVVNGKMALEDAQVPYVLDLIAEFTTQILERDELLNEALGIKNESGDGEDGESATAEEDETETPEENTASDDDETTNGEGGENGGGDGSGSDGGDGEAGGGDEPKKIDINVGALITRRIAQKDRIIGRQLNYILHAEKFQKLEASWRGLFHLVSNSEIKRKQLELKLLNVSFDDLYKDLDKAVDFDQSALFKIIYEDEYGTYGGDPYSVLIGDYELGRTSQHIQFLEMISKVAAAAHAPFIASAYAKLFDLEDFEALYKPRDLSKIFDSAELIRWRSFRESEDSRYVTLTLPKVMLRLPYDMEDNPVEGIFFNEDFARTVYKKDEAKQEIVAFDSIELETVDGVQVEKKKKQVDPRKMLWGNPAYVLAQRITNAFALHGWTAAIRGVEGGGLVEGLPDFTFDTEDGDIALQCPTQVSITDRREKELNDLGFMAICHCKGTNKAAFFGGQTTNKPKQYLKDIATKNAQISSMLPYMMAASRFAHYIKVLMREKIGSFQTRQAVQDYLNTWISQYVLLDDTPPQAIKAKFPLREANVVVVDVPGKVGAYRATVFLRPHFQLEELTTSIRLVAELPSG